MAAIQYNGDNDLSILRRRYDRYGDDAIYNDDGEYQYDGGDVTVMMTNQ
eukprot:CAMPEP_0172497778 /NCGR_PEP_ID=MMETSP1066-20121228/105174_1 /TAXON_ID=671091 /ORGANISM="Coscinodiscus wailesii, Strain CCMP2513" /LENGTH=48 /DNA_ID= /DNA_START= /DNA_END= /DNA_ORIENTATION=